MQNNLSLLTSISNSFDVSRASYRYIVEDGTRWDTFRRTFERKKWFVEGAAIGVNFIEYAKEAKSRKAYIREVHLCYNFTLKMLDKADMGEAFCAVFIQGLKDMDWKTPSGKLDEEELEFAYNHGMIEGGNSSPLDIWIHRFLANTRKRLGTAKYHLQCEDELEVRKQGVRSLVNYLRDCT